VGDIRGYGGEKEGQWVVRRKTSSQDLEFGSGSFEYRLSDTQTRTCHAPVRHERLGMEVNLAVNGTKLDLRKVSWSYITLGAKRMLDGRCS